VESWKTREKSRTPEKELLEIVIDMSHYMLECTPKKEGYECAINKYKESGTLEKTIEKVNIPNSDKIRIESNTQIDCSRFRGETMCRGRVALPPVLPNLCVNLTGVVECGIKSNRPFLLSDMIHLLMGTEAKKPGFTDFLIRNNVHLILDKTLDDKTGGYSACGLEDHLNYIAYDSRNGFDHTIGTLMHEWGHCREQIARQEKGIQEVKVGTTGGWKREEGRLMPYGHEIRAEHFRKRIMKNID
jgi:hypothetical protein